MQRYKQYLNKSITPEKIINVFRVLITSYFLAFKATKNSTIYQTIKQLNILLLNN